MATTLRYTRAGWLAGEVPPYPVDWAGEGNYLFDIPLWKYVRCDDSLAPTTLLREQDLEPAEVKVRTSAKLKALAARGQHGHPRTPRTFYISEGYHSWYWDAPKGRTAGAAEVETVAEWDTLARVLSRYHRYVQWATEVLPGWRTVRTISYMDNSSEEEQVCKCGLHTRRVMVTPPSGDLCF